MKPQTAKKVAIKYNSYRVTYLFMDVPDFVQDKDQIQLRIEFLNEYGRKIYPASAKFVVVGVGLINDVVETGQDGMGRCIGTTWDEVCNIDSHPLSDELSRYYIWKKENLKNG